MRALGPKAVNHSYLPIMVEDPKLRQLAKDSWISNFDMDDYLRILHSHLLKNNQKLS
jgi:hypothetical protein